MIRVMLIAPEKKGWKAIRYVDRDSFIEEMEMILGCRF